MKKSLLIASVAMLALVSCKKDYTCECTTSNITYLLGQATNSTPITSSGKTGKMKKDDAKKKCEENNGTTMLGTTQSGISTTIDCKIK